ncbi:MAG: pentapeptide repeat-containing protein [Maritimibacter sp.]|nr:pentapeptide repeat-containing protein [Maritimibacter sp.]
MFESHFHQLAELTFEPLLLFLLFRLGENLSQQLHYFADDGRQLPDFDRIFEMGELHGFSRNDLYQMIIWSIRNPIHRDVVEIEKPAHQGGLPENTFERTLGCLAIAAWRNGSGRRATVKEFLAEADRQGLREEALRFVSTARGRDPASEYANMSLLSVFYFQGYQRDGSDTDEFEFTHKSFADYLVAAHLFEATVRLAAETTDAPVLAGDARIDRLAEVIGDGEESIEICQFLQEEGIRYGRQRTILFETDRGVLHLYPREGQELPQIDARALEPMVWAMANGPEPARRAARFVVAIWNAIVEGDETGKHGQIAPSQFTFKALYLRIVAPITSEDLDQINSSLVPTNIAKYSIANWQLDEADLSGLNLTNASFYHCAIAGASFTATPLCNTAFNHCDLRGAQFVNCDMTSGHLYNASGFDASSCQFQLAIFEESDFNGNSFARVDFSNAEWIASTLIACEFYGCTFSEGLFTDTTFRDCVFTLCDFEDLEGQPPVFENCTFTHCRGIESTWDTGLEAGG